MVERAKALLMHSLALSEQEAFRRIQQAARNRNLRLVDVARSVLEQRDIIRQPAHDDAP